MRYQNEYYKEKLAQAQWIGNTIVEKVAYDIRNIPTVSMEAKTLRFYADILDTVNDLVEQADLELQEKALEFDRTLDSGDSSDE